MKHLISIALLFITVISFTSCGESVISYNDKIIDYNISIGDNINKFETAKTKEDFKTIITAIANDSKNGLEVSKSLEAYNENTSFRDAAIKYFEHTNTLFEDDGMLKHIMTSYSDDDFDNDNQFDSENHALFIEALNKLVELEDNLLVEQETFAKENNMQLEN